MQQEVKIKFKDRNRSDLNLKVLCFSQEFNLIRVTLACKNGVSVDKFYSADSIEEITLVTREEAK